MIRMGLLAPKAVKIFYGEKFEICCCMNYLCSNGLIGYLDLSNFGKAWPACWSDIDAKTRVRLLQNLKYFSHDVPVQDAATFKIDLLGNQ